MTEILSLYPRLVVDDADAALTFYAAAFGARTLERHTDGDGRVPAPTSGAVPVIIALYVADADEVARRMVAGGATVVFEVADQPYGERGGRLADPFGHLWMIAQRIENLATAEIQARADALHEA
jgi:uncharacterized glyoxalase superfamily protein PhnB